MPTHITHDAEALKRLTRALVRTAGEEQDEPTTLVDSLLEGSPAEFERWLLRLATGECFHNIVGRPSFDRQLMAEAIAASLRYALHALLTERDGSCALEIIAERATDLCNRVKRTCEELYGDDDGDDGDDSPHDDDPDPAGGRKLECPTETAAPATLTMMDSPEGTSPDRLVNLMREVGHGA